ncbi:(2Fe-2S)-binding protein [Mycobacterium parmense]|uniref:Uncharacterized protein n=1 Tax=Mycobacterium parmense TaxID=185642 RepID=A0A7I7YSS0_9MYCO|nr:(2Fe-2S)-binding protein [Mycobacterium parmense]MCV7351633.1 (2Fe-2S)-binding protein [Mycobacterium parmense]ORW52411.1 iron reductase [Mycobacterium parmense]BBZ44905.1 hypothetical protein MPRM_21860 [Mycobacterium parmense]
MNISAQLSDVSSYGGFFALTVGGDAAGWRPVGRCYADGCADLIDATLARYRTTEARVGASLVQLGHAARLFSPVLACVLAHGVIPDLGGLQRADDGTQLRLPEPVGERVGPDSPLPELVYRVVVRDHMEPLATGLKVKVAPALLYGNIASALVGASNALLSARPDLRRPITKLTAGLLGTGGLAGSGVLREDDLALRRRSCCLFYRVADGATCADCPL